MVYYYVWHFAMLIDNYTKFSEYRIVKIGPFVSGISNINNIGTWRKPWTEFINYFFNKFVLSSRRKINGLAWSKAQRYFFHLALFGIFLR